LKLHRELVKGRQLMVPLAVITFAPAVASLESRAVEAYPIANEGNLATILSQIEWSERGDDLYRMALSAIESLSSIRKSRSKREVTRPDSRGAKLKRLEDSIATLDHRQNKAVIETVEGVQRIRGLAGSGKTIVLALKAAYLHTQYPDWRIAVTFNTRSLKGQFKRLINNFCIEQSGEEPDWTKIRVINAWGAPGGNDRDGIYYEFCRATGQQFHDFKSASSRFGGTEKAFDGACQAALTDVTQSPQLYDAILVDEAQDFTPSFLALCYAMLREPRRLVYAYDELQNLSGTSLPPPEDIFGNDRQGRPVVTLDDPRRDVILQKCYRNSRPVLVAAHALGFGIYRTAPDSSETGLVQMFDHPELWEEIGYQLLSGLLSKGQHLILGRADETSPRFLEEHSPIDDLVRFERFESERAQYEWLVEQICANLGHDELRHDDIIVIHPDPLTARQKTGPIRKTLFERGVQNHLAGVDTVADVFFQTETPSVTFTGIYRAKGNEAGMVYVIDAQDCDRLGVGLSSLRNRLFTAMTRSKAWVRVVGVGPRMQNLVDEFERLKDQRFTLDFTYPTDDLLGKLRIVHRDLSPKEKRRIEKKKSQLADLLRDLETGELLLGDLDEKTRKKLQKILGGV
jgi:superfamily I DNA and RNA helicase